MSVIGWATTSSDATMPNVSPDVSPPMDFASRYDTSTKAGSSSKLNRNTFLYE